MCICLGQCDINMHTHTMPLLVLSLDLAFSAAFWPHFNNLYGVMAYVTLVTYSEPILTSLEKGYNKWP